MYMYVLFVCAHSHMRSHQVLESSAHFLHEKGVGEEVQLSYLQLAQNLEEFIGRTFNDWGEAVSRDLQRHLEVPLMSKSRYLSPLSLPPSPSLLTHSHRHTSPTISPAPPSLPFLTTPTTTPLPPSLPPPQIWFVELQLQQDPTEATKRDAVLGESSI